MNEWVWSIGGMILTGETEVLGEKHYTAWVVDEWMSMEHWWNDSDRGNWITGRKTLYRVSGRWMNEWVWDIGGMILIGETEVLGEKHYTAWVVDEWMNEYGALVEWYWQGKLKYREKSCPIVSFPSQITHGLVWYRTQVFVVRGWCQTARLFARIGKIVHREHLNKNFYFKAQIFRMHEICLIY